MLHQLNRDKFSIAIIHFEIAVKLMVIVYMLDSWCLRSEMDSVDLAMEAEAGDFEGMLMREHELTCLTVTRNNTRCDHCCLSVWLPFASTHSVDLSCWLFLFWCHRFFPPYWFLISLSSCLGNLPPATTLRNYMGLIRLSPVTSVQNPSKLDFFAWIVRNVYLLPSITFKTAFLVLAIMRSLGEYYEKVLYPPCTGLYGCHITSRWADDTVTLRMGHAGCGIVERGARKKVSMQI